MLLFCIFLLFLLSDRLFFPQKTIFERVSKLFCLSVSKQQNLRLQWYRAKSDFVSWGGVRGAVASMEHFLCPTRRLFLVGK